MTTVDRVLLAVKCGHLGTGGDPNGFKTLTWNGRAVSDEEALSLIETWHANICAALVGHAKKIAIAAGAVPESFDQ